MQNNTQLKQTARAFSKVRKATRNARTLQSPTYNAHCAMCISGLRIAAKFPANTNAQNAHLFYVQQHTNALLQYA